MKLSALADEIRTSPILTFAAQIEARRANGETLHNLTIGDFDSALHPLPEELSAAVFAAYQRHQTNYPGAVGEATLRASVAAYLNRGAGLTGGVALSAEQIIISGGSRPLIYALYRAVVDRGERVVYPVPSWNNEAYAQFVGAEAVTVETDPTTGFMPTAESLAPHLPGAALLALCAPQNPTGTLFAADNLRAICEAVVAENHRRGAKAKPLVVMFDQVYWALTFGGGGDGGFCHPLTMCPEIADFAVFIDGASKAFAATGLRVGWANGPPELLAKMASIIAHMGAWAPKPEQIACGEFLAQEAAVDRYLATARERLQARLAAFHAGFATLKSRGHAVDSISPAAAIYLSVRIDIDGRQDATGATISGADAVQNYLLHAAHLGVLPFSWFGANRHGNWFRLSVGACRQAQIPAILSGLETALSALR